MSKNKIYEDAKQILETCDLSDKLLIISNLLFDCYEDARKSDLMFNNLDKPVLKNVEDYAYMKELYDFEETSFVFVTLDRAHDLLSLSLKLDKLQYGE